VPATGAAPSRVADAACRSAGSSTTTAPGPRARPARQT
jgi:hypothetical protein